MINIRSNSQGSTNPTVELVTLQRGTYSIKCGGAKGGAGNGDKSQQSCLGGFGATLEGSFTLNEDSEFIILPGNPGTDHPGTSGDGTSGSGGGGTYVALVVDKDYPGALLTSGFSNVECNNKYVIPFMVAAGGNGGRDYGYSGDGTVYNGVHTTDSTFIAGSNQGGSFGNITASSTSNGSNFINGANGARDAYNRNGTSIAGFGGGGASKDDGEGGGGGGYFGGHLTKSACSYYDPNLITNVTGTTGTSLDYGYVIIEAKGKPGPYSEKGECIISISDILQKHNSIDYITINDTRITPTETTLNSYISFNGEWELFKPGDKIYSEDMSDVKLKYEFITENINVTPFVSDIEVRLYLKVKKNQLIIKLDEYTKFNNAIDKVTVLYNESVPLIDEFGISVTSFSEEFTPINVVKKVNPNENWTVTRTSKAGTISYLITTTTEITINDVDIVRRTSNTGDIKITKINNINP